MMKMLTRRRLATLQASLKMRSFSKSSDSDTYSCSEDDGLYNDSYLEYERDYHEVGNLVDLANEYKKLTNKGYDGSPLLNNYGNGYFRVNYACKLHVQRHTAIWTEAALARFPKDFLVSGPCRGLFCLYSVSGEVAVWNPGTGDIKYLTAAEDVLHYDHQHTIKINNVGFGFDAKAHSYKVIRYITRRSVDKTVDQIEIYSLKSNQWKEILVPEEITSRIPLFSAASFAEGSCYWSSAREDNLEDGIELISFDFAEEEFHIHCLPHVDGLQYTGCEMDSFNGWPAVIRYAPPSHERETNNSVFCQIWVRMPENGVKTWVCERKIERTGCSYYYAQKPLCLWKNYALIFLDKTNTLAYRDFVTNTDFGLQTYLQAPNKMENTENPRIQVVKFPENLVPNPWSSL